MGGLLDSLSVATSGLTAARTGLDVTGNNIANINTPGYARRTLQLAELPPHDGTSAGRGVEVVQIRALRDLYIEGRIGREQGGKARDAVVLEGVQGVEAAIGLPGESIDARLTAFFDGFSALANDVTSITARDTVVREGQLLGEAFGALSDRLAEMQRVHDRSLRDSVVELNQLATTVAQLNGRIVTGGADVDALRDERSVALTRMAELANVNVLNRADGAVDVTVSSGHALVVGANPYAVTVTPQAPSGFVSLGLADLDITSQLSGGRIGGLLELRDTKLPAYRTGLDQLAHDIASQVNALHVTGFDGTGAPGGNFFNAPASVAGAAASLSVTAAVAADPRLVAGSGTTSVGDNQVARAIAGLRDSRVMSGGSATAAEAWATFVYQVGSDVRAAEASSATRDQIVRQLERLRDQYSGVSLDEEAANLMRYQRSYEASARFFTTIVDTLDTLMAMVR
ncbi:MAG: flagellar hook-associated protein FlgK [Acidobacteria bacterium]|nr:flagellar hook-associated protein FlgK [Acidobacteriota bacterium]